MNMELFLKSRNCCFPALDYPQLSPSSSGAVLVSLGLSQGLSGLMGVVLFRLSVILLMSIRLQEKVPPKTELIKTEKTVVCTRTRFQISQVNTHSIGRYCFHKAA